MGASSGLDIADEFCSGGSGYGSGLICAVGLVGGILAVAVGTAVGASASHSEEEILAASTSLETVIAELQLDSMLVDRVIESGSDLESTELLPWTLADEVWGNRNSVHGEPDSVLRLDIRSFGVARYGLDSGRQYDPDLIITMEVRARLYRTSDDETLIWRTWAYRGRAHDFFDLAEDDAKLLGAEIDAGLRMVADKIVHDLFVATSPEIHGYRGMPTGAVWTVASRIREPTDE